MKRIFDLLAALTGLVVLALPLAAMIVAARRATGASGLFAHVRVGRQAVPFTCYKLRTMRPDAPIVPSHDVPADAVAPFGRFLRRTKLDELPQLWNVLTGDMSLVGPRPCLPVQDELIEARRSRGVLALQPGITGLSQVRGIDMRDPVRLATSDAEYLQSRSFFGDLVILLRTILPRRTV